MTDEKTKENRLRRAADRKGLQLLKFRGRNRFAEGAGYFIIDPWAEENTEEVIAGKFGLTLDEVEEFLSRPDMPAPKPKRKTKR